MTKRFAALPPGPSSLGTIVNAISFLRDTCTWARELHQKYGDPFTGWTPVGPAVHTGDPDNIRAIFTMEPDSFVMCGGEEVAGILGAESVLLQNGSRYKTERKLLMPYFHGARMRAYSAAIRETALRHAARWEAGRPFAMEEKMGAISREVIVRAIFGVTEPERAAIFCEAVKDFIDSLHPLLMVFPLLRREILGRGPWARVQRCRERLDNLLEQEFALRRQSLEGRQDILSLFLGARYDDGSAMSSKQICDQLRTLLFAGHETTATMMAWTMYRLHQHETVREQLLERLLALGRDADPEVIASEPYLEAVCQETLRLQPVLAGAMRRLTKPLTLKGWTLPPGVIVVPNAFLAHQRAEVFKDPQNFYPERFLNKTYSAFEFIPFGGGNRRCLGAAIAFHQMKLVVATLLTHYELRLAARRALRTVQRHFTLGPEGGASMVLIGAREGLGHDAAAF